MGYIIKSRERRQNMHARLAASVTDTDDAIIGKTWQVSSLVGTRQQRDSTVIPPWKSRESL